jgi:hypothetical protein
MAVAIAAAIAAVKDLSIILIKHKMYRKELAFLIGNSNLISIDSKDIALRYICGISNSRTNKNEVIKLRF